VSELRPLETGDPVRVAGFRIDGVLGEGGQGTVYLGHDDRTGAAAAVKVLHRRLARDPGLRRRFLREAEVARRIAPFCTARILDAGVSDGQVYIASEYVPGPSLQELVAEQGPRTGGSLQRLAVATLTGLASIHRAGIVHRDVKPANVILGPEGPVLIDFGIARVADQTSGTGVVGSPAYMSPEQFTDGPITPASDVFSWGATMVYTATGHRAYPGDSLPAVLHAILNREPDLSGVPEEIRPLLAAALSRSAGHRPQIAALLAALTRGAPLPAPRPAVEHQVTDPPPAGVGTRPEPGPVRALGRRRALGALAVTAAAGVSAAVVVPAWLKRPGSADESTGAPDATPATPVGRIPLTELYQISTGSADVRELALETGGDIPQAVTMDTGKALGVWHLEERRRLHQPMIGERGSGSARGLALGTLDGRPIAVANSDDRALRVWDLAGGRQIGPPLDAGGTVYSVAVGRAGGRDVALAGRYSGVSVWDLASGDLRTALPVGAVHALAVGEAGGKVIVVAAGTGRPTAETWNVVSGRRIARPPVDYPDVAVELAVTRIGGSPVIVGGGESGVIYVWDLASGALIRRLRGHTDAVQSLAVDPATGHIAMSCATDRTVRLWDLAAGRQLGRSLIMPRRPYAVALARSAGQTVAAVTYDRKIAVYRLAL
jgi:predicted Ser/Thr protein kinase